MKIVSAALVLIVCSCPAAAQVPTLVVRDGRLFDPATGKVGAPADLWIEGERVLGTKPAGTAVPEGASVVEADGCVLLPGMFDLHVHVWVPGGSMGRFVPAMPEDSLRSQIYCGVTHVVDLHSDPASLTELRERSRAEPDMARLYIAGAAFTAPGGHGTQFGIEANVVTKVEEVGPRFDQLLAFRPDVIKAIVEHGDWGGLSPLPALDEVVLAEIGRRASEAKIPLFCHVFSLAEAKLAVRSGARALAHGVFLGEVDAELARSMAERDVAYVPTLAVVDGAFRVQSGTQLYSSELARGALDPEVFEAVSVAGSTGMIDANLVGGGEPQHLANLKALHERGIRIGAGTDAGNPLTPHGPALLRELELYVDAGLTPAQALTAATLDSARILGVEQRFGSLEPGKIADVVVVRGDPSASIADLWNVVGVIKGGKPVDRDALARRHAEKPAPQGARIAGTDVGAVLDDFDDGDLAAAWGGSWESYADKLAPGGKSEAEVTVGDGVLVVAGELRPGVPWGAFAGATIYWSQGAEAAVDATEFTGIELRLRGAPRPYSIAVHRAAVKDYNVFARVLPVEEEWREVRIPFASLKQIGFGKPLEWSAADLTGISLDARNAPGPSGLHAPFDLEVDWVRLYRN